MERNIESEVMWGWEAGEKTFCNRHATSDTDCLPACSPSRGHHYWRTGWGDKTTWHDIQQVITVQVTYNNTGNKSDTIRYSLSLSCLLSSHPPSPRQIFSLYDTQQASRNVFLVLYYSVSGLHTLIVCGNAHKDKSVP